MWRWSYIINVGLDKAYVISTYVEMIPTIQRQKSHLIGDLHVCGDDPHSVERDCAIFMWSPRMWRWSLTKLVQVLSREVISTYVEMILKLSLNSMPQLEWSPRMWRWCTLFIANFLALRVISTYVEMILASQCPSQHMAQWSPRMWRWS